MAKYMTPDWSESRRKFAYGVASVLYGVIAIMSAELAYEPGIASRYAVAAGALLVGFAMSMTHLFVELVNIETRRGAHVGLHEAWELLHPRNGLSPWLRSFSKASRWLRIRTRSRPRAFCWID